MSEKPVASIKTLARYEPDIVYIGTGEYVAECVRADDGDYYLAADVDAAIEALLAEVERLRADRDSWEQQASDRVADWHAEYLRAERLAEALEDIRSRSSIDLATRSNPFELTARLGDIHQIADSALSNGGKA